MDIATATDTFIDHFINPHYLIDHEPTSLLLSKNEVPPDARQDDEIGEYDDDDDGDSNDFYHIPFSKACLSEADSASLTSDATTTPILQDHAASAAIVSALTQEIISAQSSNCNDNTVAKAGEEPSLDFIYHILFYDFDQLLAESHYHLPLSQRRRTQRTTSIAAGPPAPAPPSVATIGNNDKNKRRRDHAPPSPAPFDMDAILRAQQEFIHRRHIEEEQAECRGEKVMASLPKRCRKRTESHPYHA